jgi:hypothetical protein
MSGSGPIQTALFQAGVRTLPVANREHARKPLHRRKLRTVADLRRSAPVLTRGAPVNRSQRSASVRTGRWLPEGYEFANRSLFAAVLGSVLSRTRTRSRIDRKGLHVRPWQAGARGSQGAYASWGSSVAMAASACARSNLLRLHRHERLSSRCSPGSAPRDGRSRLEPAP